MDESVHRSIAVAGPSGQDVLEDVTFSGSFGPVGRELLIASREALEEGVSPLAVAIPLGRAMTHANGGIWGGATTREGGVQEAHTLLQNEAQRATGRLRHLLYVIDTFLMSGCATLEERVHELSKLSTYLLGRIASLDAIAKPCKRKRADDEDVKNRQQQGMQAQSSEPPKRLRKGKAKLASSRGEVKGRAGRALARAKAKAAQDDVGAFLVTLLRATRKQECLPEELQDTASSAITTLEDLL